MQAAMLLAPIAALLTLAEPAGSSPTTDEPKVIVDQPATAVPPAAEPVLPAVPATQPPAPTVPPVPPPAPPVRPTAGFGLEIGYARGGERFLTLVTPAGGGTSAAAGDGLFFSLAGSWTPYWSSRGVGLGVYGRAGAKYFGLTDGTTAASFLRVPVAVAAQLLVPVVGRWFVLGRLGVISEVLAELTITSAGASRSSRDFSPRLGQFIDAGMYWAPSERSGLAAMARYERLDVSYAGGVTNANNLGALVAAYLRF
jgi:hypothetical protein